MTTRRELANAVRALAMDAVEAAKSGHPGMPMGMADIAEVLWNDFLHFNPANPKWFNRDRFVLSNGHGSMLQYALLHLSGFDLPMEQLKRFRQLHSKTAGHPEASETPGVETTTGPLGQGLANAVGFALAEKVLAAHFNRPGHAVVDHHTYVFLGDGCLMEGVSHEVASLAGTWQLGKLVAIYDDNGISIDGEVQGWFTDDTPARFEAYGWNVIRGVDGHDAEAVKKAIASAAAQNDKPTLICAKTIIGFGAPHKQGKEESHGAPLGKDEIAAARAQLGWNHAPFEIPAEIYEGWDHRAAGSEAEQSWNDAFAKYAAAHPELAAEFERRIAGELPARLGGKIPGVHRQAAARWPRSGVTQGLANGPGCVWSAAAGADRRLGRPGRFQPHQMERQPRRRHRQQRGRQGQLRLLRRARVRHDRDRQWPRVARWFHSVRRHLPGVLRLRAQRGAHERADPRARDPRLHARLDRPGRGRPDSPAGRAHGVLALHPEQPPVASVRRGGIGGVVEGGDRAQGRAVVPGVLAAEPQASAAQRAAGGRHPARRLRAVRSAGHEVPGDPDRHRLGSGAGDGSFARAGAARRSRARGVDAVHRSVRRAAAGIPRRRAAALVPRPRGGGGGHRRLLAQVRGPGRRSGRHDHVWCLGAGAAAVRALRLHRRRTSSTR